MMAGFSGMEELFFDPKYYHFYMADADTIRLVAPTFIL